MISTYAFYAAPILCAAVLAGGITLCVKYYSLNVVKISGLLRRCAAKILAMPPCESANAGEIKNIVLRSQNAALIAAHARYSDDTAVLLHGGTAPEAGGYFNLQSVYKLPDARGYRDIVRGLMAAAGLISCALPPALALLGGVRPGTDTDAFFSICGLAVISALWAAFVYSVIDSIGKRAMLRAFAATDDFVSALQRALPTAGAASQAALLIESSKRTRESFAESAAEITKKIDNFASHTVAPAAAKEFEQSIKTYIAPVFVSIDKTLAEFSAAIINKQDEGLKNLAETFADHLYEIIDEKITALAEGVGFAEKSVMATADTLAGIAESLKLGFNEDREAFKSAGELSLKTAEAQQKTAESLEGFAAYLNEAKAITKSNGEQLGLFLTQMEETAKRGEALEIGHSKRMGELRGEITAAAGALTDSFEKSRLFIAENLSENDRRFAERMEIMNGLLKDALEKNSVTAEKLAGMADSLANAGSEQYEKAARAAASLLDNVVAEMNRAMGGVGHEIAESIGKASGENAEIVARLAEQTNMLKQEYETYFERINEENRNSYDELDFHMQNIIARFANEAGETIAKLQQSITSAMELFEGNTATLLNSLDEQSRSIGLHAKELTFDISALSSGLKESVAEFSEHIHGGVVRTFDDFDSGLAEVSKRLANTVESIRDSVESLPAALSGMAGKG